MARRSRIVLVMFALPFLVDPCPAAGVGAIAMARAEFHRTLRSNWARRPWQLLSLVGYGGVSA